MLKIKDIWYNTSFIIQIEFLDVKDEPEESFYSVYFSQPVSDSVPCKLLFCKSSKQWLLEEVEYNETEVDAWVVYAGGKDMKNVEKLLNS